MWKGCLCYKENLPNLTHNFEICPSWTNIWPLCFQATICCVAVMWHGWFFWAFLTSGLPSGCPDRCHSKPSASRPPDHWFYAFPAPTSPAVLAAGVKHSGSSVAAGCDTERYMSTPSQSSWDALPLRPAGRRLCSRS